MVFGREHLETRGVKRAHSFIFDCLALSMNILVASASARRVGAALFLLKNKESDKCESKNNHITNPTSLTQSFMM